MIIDILRLAKQAEIYIRNITEDEDDKIRVYKKEIPFDQIPDEIKKQLELIPPIQLGGIETYEIQIKELEIYEEFLTQEPILIDRSKSSK